jgi:tRNA (guanosine-2'-O-)-methyltransferase
MKREMPQLRPITERRRKRMIEVLEQRQPDLTVVIENVHDPHNISAVLRSCDAVGVTAVHLVYTVEECPKLNRVVASGALRWLDIIDHPSIEACYDALRGEGFRIYATHLDDNRLELFDLNLIQPSALVFGNEKRGVSPEAAAAADATMVIPMMGMVQSLNISVACAVTLYEALRQRRAANVYQQPRLPTSEIDTRLDGWLRRERRIIQ